MNTRFRLAAFPLFRAPCVVHSDTPQAGRRSARRVLTRELDFQNQQPDNAHSSVPLQRTASSSRLVSHWVILEGCSRRMFWTLST